MSPIAARAVPEAVPAGAGPLAGVLDIGSNSIRLVVYRAGARAPETLFNEKLMAGLGAGVARHGRLEADAMALASAGLARFAAMARAMGVAELRAVATAAVRDAANGREFVDRVERETGLDIEVIDGETEARASAYGVISAIPAADGVVGDLGGGSLELVRVAGGRPGARVSLAVGSLKLAAARAEGRAALRRLIDTALAKVGWLGDGLGRPLYAVGGSWRALAHYHMHVTAAPLPVIHHYTMGADAPDRLVRSLARMAEKSLKEVPGVSAQRAAALPGAAALIGAVVDRLRASHIVTSAYGLREGLLYQSLPAELRARDPLIEAARLEAARLSRFAETGEALTRWTAALFAADPAPFQRIRVAACLLSDVAWNANPDFRAERAADIALHGSWVGVTLPERALLAAALFACMGGERDALLGARWPALAEPYAVQRAWAWGLAARLGQRLGGGASGVLGPVALEPAGAGARLVVPDHLQALIGASVTRRLKALNAALAG
ncbi:MAG: Ppx/GppA family phosphatase [Sphingomonadaceae bacterium]|nr:Ppx/GppA family phosphatase [Sphingomonadaceae bacterium]